MKLLFRNIIVSYLLLNLAGCAKDASPVNPIEEKVGDNAVLQAAGDFGDGPYGHVSGKALVYDSAGYLKLQLKNLNATNGPDLKVYLSQERVPLHFISLGSLKSTMGNQVYGIPGTPDWRDYPYVLVHCEAYNHLFGSAPLK